MTPIRRLLRQNRALAALAIAAALLLRVLVPAGFMPVVGAGGVSLSVCPGATIAAMPMRHGAMAMHGGGHDEAPTAARGCAFADLAVPLIGGADTVLLAAAIAFVLALGVTRRASLPLPAGSRPRPPSHGPPAFA